MEYVINLNAIDKSLAKDVEKIVQDMKDYYSKKVFYPERIVFLHAWKPAVYDTCFAFAEVDRMYLNIFFVWKGYTRFAPQISTKILISEFYLSYQSELCDKVMIGWLDEQTEKREFNHIWKALLDLFPDYTAPIVKYEKYIPYNLTRIVGAEEYSKQGLLFQLTESKNTNLSCKYKYEEWKVSNYGEKDEKRNQLAIRMSDTGFQTEEEYENHILSYFKEKLLKKALLSIPHKTHYLDTPLSDVESRILGATHNCREIHVYESKTDVTYILLNKESVHFGYPGEGGTMGGSVFNKILEVPAEEFNWTREQMIEKYEKYFA